LSADSHAGDSQGDHSPRGLWLAIHWGQVLCDELGYRDLDSQSGTWPILDVVVAIPNRGLAKRAAELGTLIFRPLRSSKKDHLRIANDRIKERWRGNLEADHGPLRATTADVADPESHGAKA
jgi:hypothetical protein